MVDKYPKEIKNFIIEAISRLHLEIGSRYIKSHLEMALTELEKAVKIEKIKNKK